VPEVHGAADWMAAPTMHAVAACYGMEWLGLQQPAMAWSGGAGGGARHVRRLGEVVRGAAFPHENVVGQVARKCMRLQLGRCEAEPHQCDVLVVPRVAVGERRALRHAGDLVAVVPPG
jgi:hypothetical protein